MVLFALFRSMCIIFIKNLLWQSMASEYESGLDWYRLSLNHSDFTFIETSRIWIFNGILVYTPCKDLHTQVKSPQYQYESESY